jgi:hypothetical protein
VGSEESGATPRAGEVACGRPFRLPPAGAMRLTARFPQAAPADKQMVTGTVQITAEEAVSGVAAGSADAFLVRAGRVVTTPLPRDAIGVRLALAAGETKSVPATASLVPCEPGGGSLPRGDYELYVQFVVTPGDGSPTTAYGGPWPLRVQ